MKQKIIALAFGALLAATLPARAQTAASATAPTATPAPAAAAPAPALSLTLTPAYVSTYMFRGQRLGGQAFQPAVEADYGSWALGVWTNFPASPGNKVAGTSDPEVDPYGSYTFTVADNFSVQPGFAWYTYPHANTSNGFYRMSFEPNVAVNYTVAGVKLTPKFYYDTVLQGATYEFTAGYALPLKDAGTELDFTGTAGTYDIRDSIDHSVPKTKAWGNYWLLGVAAPFQITKESKLTVGWAYTKGTDAYSKQAGSPKAVNTLAVGRGVLSVSYAWTF